MARRYRFWLRRIFLSLLVLCLFAGLAGWLFWQHLRTQWGVTQVDLRGIEISAEQLRIAELQLLVDRPGVAFQLQGEDLHIAWRHTPALGWHLADLQLRQLKVTQLVATQPETSSEGVLVNLDPEQLFPASLPQRASVGRIALDLPCQQSRCQLFASADFTRAPAPTLHISLEREEHRIELFAFSEGGPLAALKARLEIDAEPFASMDSRWQASAAGNTWNGSLNILDRGDSPLLWSWMAPWLSEWTGPLPPMQEAPGSLVLNADWLLQLPTGPIDARRLRAASGHVDLQARLSAPLPVPGVGALGGSAIIQLLGAGGHWQARQLKAQLQLQAPDPTLLAILPDGADPGVLDFRLSAETLALTDEALALQLGVSSSGPLRIEGEAPLRVSIDPQAWAVQFEEAQIQLRAPRLQHNDIRLSGLHAQLTASGRADQNALELSLLPGSQLNAMALSYNTSPALEAQQLQLELAGLHWARELNAGQTLVAPLQLRLARLEHPSLQPLAWHWRGRLENAAERLTLEGALSNDAGLSLTSRLKHDVSGSVLEGEVAELRFATGNPLAATLADWPPALELNTGSGALTGTLSLPAQGSPRIRARLALADVAGIFDSSEVEGLDGLLQLGVRDEQLQVTLETLTVERLNPGIALSSLDLRGEYHSALAAPVEGRVSWQKARAQLLGGSIWLEPADLQLAASNPPRSLHVQGLSLQELLKTYPAQGLEGDGTIDGELPLLLTPEGLSITQGHLAAREPGGRLHFSSPKLSAFGASNPAMGLVVQALNNFHYSRLQSGVDYSTQGTLQLALRLEGRNPQIENGRPIHFNINIEEDIPALLTSLQLSGKVSERIQQRMQQRVQQRMREAEPATP